MFKENQNNFFISIGEVDKSTLFGFSFVLSYMLISSHISPNTEGSEV